MSGIMRSSEEGGKKKDGKRVFVRTETAPKVAFLGGDISARHGKRDREKIEQVPR
jgi:hypothetical protein